MYRPDGWKNPHPYGKYGNKGHAYEEGADDMLELSRKHGDHRRPHAIYK